MITTKKNTTLNTKAKGIIVQNGTLIDYETGEDIIPILARIYGDRTFDMAISLKDEEEVDE